MQNKGIGLKAEKGKRVVALFPFFLILTLVTLTLIRPTVLWIEESDGDGHTGRAVFFLNPGEEFAISYTHSVDLLPVVEIYYSDGESIYLKETHFRNFGAGMGLLEGRGRYVEEEGLLKIVGIDEKLDSFILRVGLIADQRLLYRGSEYVLAGFFGEDARLLFQVKKIPLYKALAEDAFSGKPEKLR